jgi:hypothetical protein
MRLPWGRARLTTSFNLSLKALRAEDRSAYEAFTCLGVLPEDAVIAWMRHQTTAYDRMAIPRVKGRRRQVRRLLAQHSKMLLDAYRTGGKSMPRPAPCSGHSRAGRPWSKRPRREATCWTGR